MGKLISIYTNTMNILKIQIGFVIYQSYKSIICHILHIQWYITRLFGLLFERLNIILEVFSIISIYLTYTDVTSDNINEM